MHFLLQKDIGSDECDKDSGYEPDQVNFWPRNSVSSAKRAGFRNKKQRSLDVHDVRKGYNLIVTMFRENRKINFPRTRIRVNWAIMNIISYRL